MFNISRNQFVTMTQGDTAEMYIYINLGTELEPIWYHLGQYDNVYFSVMEPHQKFEDGVIRKVFGKDDEKTDPGSVIPYVVLHLDNTDTENLLPGVYYYSIKIVRRAAEYGSEEVVDTIVSKKKFIIIE